MFKESSVLCQRLLDAYAVKVKFLCQGPLRYTTLVGAHSYIFILFVYLIHLFKPPKKEIKVT